MRKTILSLFSLAALLVLSVRTVAAQERPAAKTGWNFGPLPAVGFNTDLGFQMGALCDIY